MKWTKSELLEMKDDIRFEEDVELNPAIFQDNPLITGAEDIHVEGRGHYDETEDRLYLSLHLDGVMICPDAITYEEIEVPFETDSEEIYSFEKTEEDGVRIVNGEAVDTFEAVIDAILLEAPMQVTLVEEGQYPEGDGWKVYSEAEYQESRKDQIDPRLAKLKQFKSE